MQLRFRGRRTARRIAIVDTYGFSSSVRQRLRLKHLGLGNESIDLIETAIRQWFRIIVRHPTAQLSMPSALVDDLWHELLLHTRDYAAFCKAAFGRFLHHEPESAMSPGHAAANRSRQLLVTLRLAQEDENCDSDALPLLFRVDSEVGLPGARCYLADCGGREKCDLTRSPVCLRHLAASENPPLASRPSGTFKMIGHHGYWVPYRRGGGW
ncbi:MAG: glycine-rich domain-containing protein [Pseudonocardiaceae bacterium]